MGGGDKEIKGVSPLPLPRGRVHARPREDRGGLPFRVRFSRFSPSLRARYLSISLLLRFRFSTCFLPSRSTPPPQFRSWIIHRASR